MVQAYDDEGVLLAADAFRVLAAYRLLRDRVAALEALYRDPRLVRDLVDVADDLKHALADDTAGWQGSVAFMEGVQ